MATAIQRAPRFDTFAELLHRLGDVPLERIRMEAPPGTATEKYRPGVVPKVLRKSAMNALTLS